MKCTHQAINQDSGDVEYYTDPKLVEAAREVMGHISLDPASSVYANENHVGADNFYTKYTDGLAKKWYGNVWMNHPFSKGELACPADRSKCKKKACNDPKSRNYRGYHIDEDIPSNMDWISKLISEYKGGNIRQACNITFGSTSEQWFQLLADYPQVLLSPRTNYYRPDGTLMKGITKGSVITYLGDNVEKFAEVFSAFGKVHIPYNFQLKRAA